jgi:hypothetical protein
MSWIQTYTGKQFYPLTPSLEAIDVRDIAHSLSLQCRYNGHCRVFYSVADHSLRVSRIVPPEHALWGLLHDAAEAYLTDLPRPVKHAVDGYDRLEDSLLRVIAQRFDLGWPMPEAVRHADDVLLATEMRDLLGPPPAPWPLSASPRTETIVPLTAREAEQAFLARHRELCGSE